MAPNPPPRRTSVGTLRVVSTGWRSVPDPDATERGPEHLPEQTALDLWAQLRDADADDFVRDVPVGLLRALLEPHLPDRSVRYQPSVEVRNDAAGVTYHVATEKDSDGRHALAWLAIEADKPGPAAKAWRPPANALAEIAAAQAAKVERRLESKGEALDGRPHQNLSVNLDDAAPITDSRIAIVADLLREGHQRADIINMLSGEEGSPSVPTIDRWLRKARAADPTLPQATRAGAPILRIRAIKEAYQKSKSKGTDR